MGPPRHIKTCQKFSPRPLGFWQKFSFPMRENLPRSWWDRVVKIWNVTFLIEHVFFTVWLVFEREWILTRPSRGAKALVILLEIKTSKIFRFLGAFQLWFVTECLIESFRCWKNLKWGIIKFWVPSDKMIMTMKFWYKCNLSSFWVLRLGIFAPVFVL